MASSSKKSTSPAVAKKASAALAGRSTSTPTKSIAGSVLKQTGTSSGTSKKVATAAAKALKDGRTPKGTKSLAGSALAQVSKGGPGTGSGGPRKK